jgi:hypothetical protein
MLPVSRSFTGGTTLPAGGTLAATGLAGGGEVAGVEGLLVADVAWLDVWTGALSCAKTRPPTNADANAAAKQTIRTIHSPELHHHPLATRLGTARPRRLRNSKPLYLRQLLPLLACYHQQDTPTRIQKDSSFPREKTCSASQIKHMPMTSGKQSFRASHACTAHAKTHPEKWLGPCLTPGKPIFCRGHAQKIAMTVISLTVQQPPRQQNQDDDTGRKRAQGPPRHRWPHR